MVQLGHYPVEQILLQVGIFDDYPGRWLPDVGTIPVYQPCKWVGGTKATVSHSAGSLGRFMLSQVAWNSGTQAEAAGCHHTLAHVG